ncbi:MAG: DUF2809 domain-containing protein [Oscillospiraceae bacterium]
MTAWKNLFAGKKRLCYAAVFILLLAVEVLIGLFGRGFVRGFLGDVLAVMAVYCAARTVLCEKPVLLSAWVTGFAFAVELIQLTDFSKLFGEGTLFSVIVGATFDPLDLLCYAAGGAVCAAWDLALVKRR